MLTINPPFAVPELASGGSLLKAPSFILMVVRRSGLALPRVVSKIPIRELLLKKRISFFRKKRIFFFRKQTIFFFQKKKKKKKKSFFL